MSEYITIKRTELEQALEAMRFALHVGFDESSESQIKKADKASRQHWSAIRAIEAALAQQAEPVAWLAPRNVDSYSRPDLGYETCSETDYGAFPVYTAPPQQTYPVYYEVSSVVTHNLWMRVSKSQYDEYVRSGWEGRTLHALTQQNITDSNKEN